VAPAEKTKGQYGSGNEGYRRLKQNGGRFLGASMAETKEELLARIAELEKPVATKKAGKLEFRVSEKGGVSVYGLRRFPVTL